MFTISVVGILFVIGVGAQNACRTPGGGPGSCISIVRCQPMQGLLSSRPTPQEADFLRKSLCGYEGQTPKVCCPSQPQQGDLPRPSGCYTPEGYSGDCVDVKNCPQVLALLQQRPIPQERLDYIRQLRCQGAAAYSVCCADTAGPPPPEPVPQSGCASAAGLPEPGGGCCGVESAGGNRIIGGNETNIDQYPWMALIEYRRTNGDGIRTLCGGALISTKFVLTAGHCVLGDVLKSGRPVNVRLGEYDTSTSRDCVPADGGGEDCAEPTVTIPIQQTIPHPQYDPYAALRRDDIALIKLRSAAPYTDFIRPICMPKVDLTASSTEVKLWAAGWGATNSSTSSSKKKLHVDLPYKTLQECQKQYNVPRRSIKLWTKQLCAGGVKDRDSCKGDSGGPLMLDRSSTFEIVGVVSFGTTPCGMENVPGVYTKVYEYLQWIRNEVAKR